MDVGVNVLFDFLADFNVITCGKVNPILLQFYGEIKINKYGIVVIIRKIL